MNPINIFLLINNFPLLINNIFHLINNSILQLIHKRQINTKTHNILILILFISHLLIKRNLIYNTLNHLQISNTYLNSNRHYLIFLNSHNMGIIILLNKDFKDINNNTLPILIKVIHANSLINIENMKNGWVYIITYK